jgi:primosomal protein N''
LEDANTKEQSLERKIEDMIAQREADLKQQKDNYEKKISDLEMQISQYERDNSDAAKFK